MKSMSLFRISKRRFHFFFNYDSYTEDEMEILEIQRKMNIKQENQDIIMLSP